MIETSGLRKSFRTRSGRHNVTVDAVRGVNLAVAKGEVFGFPGPNGAGKTTTLRMLATLIVPDVGDATIAGADLRSDPAGVRSRIGYVAQSGGTWDDVSAREELAMQARTHGFAKAEALRRAGDPSAWKGLVIVVVLAALAVAWSARLFARSLR
jgi:ABC-2 type transport system ATP-binding protein